MMFYRTVPTYHLTRWTTLYLNRRWRGQRAVQVRGGAGRHAEAAGRIFNRHFRDVFKLKPLPRVSIHVGICSSLVLKLFSICTYNPKCLLNCTPAWQEAEEGRRQAEEEETRPRTAGKLLFHFYSFAHNIHLYIRTFHIACHGNRIHFHPGPDGRGEPALRPRRPRHGRPHVHGGHTTGELSVQLDPLIDLLLILHLNCFSVLADIVRL